jgi:hypothetical protein
MADLTIAEKRGVLDTIIPQVWLPILIDTTRKETTLEKYLENKVSHFDKKTGRVYIKYETGSNFGGTGTRREQQELPTPNERTFAEAYTNMLYDYLSLEITGPHMELSFGALVDNVMHYIKSSRKAHLAERNRMNWGNGSGQVAQASVNPSDHSYPSYDTSTGWTGVKIKTSNTMAGSIHWFHRNKYYYLGDDTTQRACEFVDVENEVVYFEGDVVSLIEDDTWIRTKLSTEVQGEPMGLLGIINNVNPPGQSHFQQLDRSVVANDMARGVVINVSGLPTSMAMRQGFQLVENLGEELPDLLLTEHGVFNSYISGLEARNQPTQTIVSDMGYASVVSYTVKGKKVTIETVKDCPAGVMMGINTSSLKLCEPVKLEPINKGDRKGFRQIPNHDAFRMDLRNYRQLICIDCRKNVLFSNITRDAPGC